MRIESGKDAGSSRSNPYRSRRWPLKENRNDGSKASGGEVTSKVIKIIAVLVVFYYAFWGATLHYGLWHPIEPLIYSPNEKTGRTHYQVYRVFSEHNILFEILVPVWFEGYGSKLEKELWNQNDES